MQALLGEIIFITSLLLFETNTDLHTTAALVMDAQSAVACRFTYKRSVDTLRAKCLLRFFTAESSSSLYGTSASR